MATNRPVAPEPSHLTEFASDRYFQKLSQQNQQQQHQQALDSSIGHSSSSPFILPLRESKAVEADPTRPIGPKREKSRFASFRHKVSLPLRKSSHTEPDYVIPRAATRPSIESTRKSTPIDQSFLALPNELQIQILSLLPLTEILNLRLASKSWHALITLHETPIVRYHLDHHIPAYVLRLYPISDNRKANLHYLCGLWHRLHVAAKLSNLMCDWITKDIFLRTTEAQLRAFAEPRERMRRRLIPLLFTIFHFFETYRKLHLQHMNELGHGLQRKPYTRNPIEVQIMNMYDDKTLLRVHEAFPLVISSFCRRLRPPTYVGRVERTMRGYVREKPSEDVHVAILCIGGLRQVERLWEIKGYNNRRSAVDEWYSGLIKHAPGLEPMGKPRRGFMGLGRKKSTNCDAANHQSANDGSFRRGSATGSLDADYMDIDSCNWVFNTSLAAGAPMGSLSHDQAQQILEDLPVLQQIWLTTAEALILERKIVDHSQHIKRNQQFMLDLIREDGINEEDEWWYGRNNPDSLRTVVGVHDDDQD